MMDDKKEINRRIVEAATYDTEQARHAVNQALCYYESEIDRLMENNDKHKEVVILLNTEIDRLKREYNEEVDAYYRGDLESLKEENRQMRELLERVSHGKNTPARSSVRGFLLTDAGLVELTLQRWE